MTEYRYDDVGYESRIQKIEEEINKLEEELKICSKKTSFELLEKLDKQKRKLKKEVEQLIIELEVEDFLMDGPKGKDPN